MSQTRTDAIRATAALLVFAAGAATHALAQGPLSEPFPDPMDLSRLFAMGGRPGFLMLGDRELRQSGHVVAPAGDVNGDGIPDVIIGTNSSSTAFVVFGRSALADPFGAEFGLADLDGTDGFRIEDGSGVPSTGQAVASAGDVNGDGIDDLLIGSPRASVGEEPDVRVEAGSAYVVFGRDAAMGGAFPATLDLAHLDGTNGFRINGVDAGDQAGDAVSPAGDLNGDGVGDLLIGADRASPGGLTSAGSAFVVFGRDTATGGAFPAVIELADLDGSNGLRMDGLDRFDSFGRALAAAGDINHDGLDDIVLSARGASPAGTRESGTCYVIYGRNAAAGASFPAMLPLEELDGTNGFRLEGMTRDGGAKALAPAGDVNGDGVDDLVLGADGAWPDGRSNAGSVYVFYGRDTAAGGAFPAALPLAGLDGTNGFRLDGATTSARAGVSVAAAGDVNGDGAGDLVIATRTHVPDRVGANASYVVFGRVAGAPPFPATRLLSELGGDGFRINGGQQFEDSGRSVAPAGDLNGDGMEDFMIGAPQADPTPTSLVGRVYVIYGRDLSCPGDLDHDGELTIFDFLTFGNLFDLMDPTVDFDHDGAFTIFDFLAFQNAFDAGCA